VAALTSTIARNAGWLLADRLVRLGGSLLLSLLVARALGPDDFGRLSLALALSLLVAAVATLGLDTMLVRELLSEPAAEPALLGSALALRLGGSLLAALLMVVLAAVLRPNDALAVPLAAVLGLAGLFNSSLALDLWFQARQRHDGAVLARGVAFLLAAIARVALILTGAPLLAFAAMYALEAMLGAVAGVFAYRHFGGRPLAWRFDRGRAGRLLADSWPLILSGLLVNLYLRADQLLLGQLRGDGDLGVYSAAVRLAEAIPLLPGIVVSAALPTLLAARADGQGRYEARLQRLYGLVVAIGYACALLFTLGAVPLVGLLLGSDYADAVPQLVVLAWASLFAGLGLARSSHLIAENLARLHLATVAVGCVANLLLNCLLIPPMGGLGAAIASLVSYWLAVHGACFLFPPLRPTGRALTRALLWPRFW
jgi:O-antigen/teichoic acid export membrane protein